MQSAGLSERETGRGVQHADKSTSQTVTGLRPNREMKDG